jgi:hypothetical protein
MLRRIFGLKRDEVTGGRINLCNENLHNLFSSPNKIKMTKLRKMTWERHLVRMEEDECVQDIYGKVRRKETTRLVDSIKMDHTERIGWYGLHPSGL